MDENKFHELDYTHEQLEELLDKISNGYILTEKEHKFLKELMGTSNNPSEDEEEIVPIDPEDFITKDEILDYVNNSLKQAGAATKEDLNDLQDDMSTLHNSDMENLRIEMIGEINKTIGNEIGDLEEYVGDALEQVEGALEQLESNLDRIEDALAQVEDVIKPSEPSGPSVELPNDLLNRIEQLESTTENLVDSSNTLVTATNSLRARMNSVENTTNSLVTRVENLETNSSPGTGGDSSVPSDELDNLTKKVSSLESTVNSHNSSINTLDEKFKKLENMLDEPASYTRPTASITASKTLIESGVSTSITVTPKFNKNDAGEMTACIIEGSPSGNKGDLSAFTDNLNLSHNQTVTYKFTVNYAEGPKKTTSMGNVDNNNIKAGTISATTQVRAVAASYYGAINGAELLESDISTLTKTTRSSKDSTVTYNLNNQRSVYMYPSSFGTISSIKDANGFDYIDSYSLVKMTYKEVEYNVYLMKEPTTITGFRQTFA